MGYGKVGSSFAKTCIEELNQPLHLWTDSAPKSNEDTPNFHSIERRDAFRLTSGTTNLVCLAIPDRALSTYYRTKVEAALGEHDCVIHFAGSQSLLPSDQFESACLHPPASLSRNKRWPRGLQVALSASSKTMFKRLVLLCDSLKLENFERPDNVEVYHAGCVVAASLPYALLHAAHTILCQGGLTPEQATRTVNQLFASVKSLTTDNKDQRTLLHEATGPATRNDRKSIEGHLNVLEPEHSQLYRILSDYLERHAQPDT